MKIYSLSLTLAFASLTSFALKIPLKQAKRSSLSRISGGTSYKVHQSDNVALKPTVLAANGNSSGDAIQSLDSFHDMIYLTNITLGGISYVVQFDSGSSDLWIKGSTSPLPNVTQTSMTYNLTYGIGWAYGQVSYSPVTFAGISIPSQAFLDVSSAVNPALSYSDGILGLGFTSLSEIDLLVNSTGSSTGRSLLYNLFADNPSEPNLITFLLERSNTTDSITEVEGSFTVGEYEPQYAAVANNIAIPTFPVNSPDRWSVLLDALLIGNQTITPTSVIPNAPGDKAVIALDSGTSYIYAPTTICRAIYGNIPGAQLDPSGSWSVPCGVEIDMAFQIAGQVFPIHPLDVTPPSLVDPSKCVGAFLPQDIAVGQGDFDWLVGDSFLRSVYTVYDFGDFDSSHKMGNPYVKLLSLVDPNQASTEFHQVWGGTPNSNITYSVSNAGAAASDSTSVTLPTDVTNTLVKIGKYFPVMFGIMALNALVLLGLLLLGIVYLVRYRSPRTPDRTPRRRLSPMPQNPRSSIRASHVGEVQLQPHAYQPVSMAFTEDTLFTPPSPAFRSFSGDTLKGGDRPKSIA